MYNFPSAPALGQTFVDAASGVTYEWNGYGWKIKTTPAGGGGGGTTIAPGGQIGQCRLYKSDNNLRLIPQDGNAIFINGVWQTVPSGGITLAPPGTTGTTYYIYAYMNGSLLALEASTTGYATTLNGIKVKNGDSTRLLVGMARTVANAWEDSPTKRLVLSYFNRRNISVGNVLANTTTVSGGAYSVISAAAAYEFLSWGDEATQVSCQNGFRCPTPNQGHIASGEGVTASVWSMAFTWNDYENTAGASAARFFTEGHHLMNLLGGVNSGSGSYIAGFTAHSAMIMG